MQVAEITPQGPLCAHEWTTGGAISSHYQRSLRVDLVAIRLVLEKLVSPCNENVLPQLNLPPVIDAAPLLMLTAAILGLCWYAQCPN